MGKEWSSCNDALGSAERVVALLLGRKGSFAGKETWPE